MPNSSSFNAYLSQPIRGEFALAIVTGNREAHHFVSEYFAFVHAKERKEYCKRFRIDNAHWLESEFHHTVDDECQSAFVAARAALDGYILEKFESTKDPYYGSRLFELQPIPEIRLLTYWMQGLFDTELKRTARWTQCVPLREFLSKIFQSPKFRDIDFPKDNNGPG